MQLPNEARIDPEACESGERTQLQAARSENCVLQNGSARIQLQLNPPSSQTAGFWEWSRGSLEARATQPALPAFLPAAESTVPSPAAGSRP